MRSTESSGRPVFRASPGVKRRLASPRLDSQSDSCPIEVTPNLDDAAAGSDSDADAPAIPGAGIPTMTPNSALHFRMSRNLSAGTDSPTDQCFGSLSTQSRAARRAPAQRVEGCTRLGTVARPLAAQSDGRAHTRLGGPLEDCHATRRGGFRTNPTHTKGRMVARLKAG